MGTLKYLYLLILPAAALAQTPAQYYKYFANRGYAMRDVTLMDRGNGIEVIAPHSVTSALPDEAEAEAWLQATTNPPMPAPNGIETPVMILTDLADTNTAYGYYSDEGELIGGIFDHASPRDPAAIKQRIESNRVFRTVLRQEARTVRTNMTANIDTMTATTGLTNGFTATQNRQLVNDLRRELIDTQKELNDLAGIVRKILKDNSGD